MFLLQDRPTPRGTRRLRGRVQACTVATPLPSTPPLEPSVGELGVQGPAHWASITQCLNIYCPTSPGGTVRRKALVCLLTLDKVLRKSAGRSPSLDLPDDYPAPPGCSHRGSVALGEPVPAEHVAFSNSNARPGGRHVRPAAEARQYSRDSRV